MRQILVFLCFILCTFSYAQYFEKITSDPLTLQAADSRSVNWIDVNNDGFVDCFISNGPAGGQNNHLFINNKNGGFTFVTSDPIVADNKPSDGASFADIDNDGDQDAFIVNWYNVNNLLYLNKGDGSFIKIDTGKVVNDGGYSETAAWGDYDKDGLVDLYVCNSEGNFKNYFYKNLGNNYFIHNTNDVSVIDAYASRCVNWTDIDMDGDLDIFITNENNQNENLYLNNGNGNFIKYTTGPLLNNAGNTMSASWADYDNDGDLDVFLTNYQSTNSLFRNDGNLNFTKIVNDTVSKTKSLSFSSAWADIDNDGDEDLFVTNSFSANNNKLVNYLYMNDGYGHFERNTKDPVTKDSSFSYGCAFADYDNDGDMDLEVATCRIKTTDYTDYLYRNVGNANHWITIKLQGVKSNQAAVGAKIKVKTTINGIPLWQLREISSQSSYCGQNDMRAHFGLANAITVDSIIIEWPLGLVEYYTQILADKFYAWKEGAKTSQIENLPNKKLCVFPNPVKDYIEINLAEENFHKGDSLKILDQSGKIIYTTEINETQSYIKINLLKLNITKGNYFISWTRNGTSVSCGFIR